MPAKKKIYFAGSIKGGRADQKTYFLLIENLKKYGEVLTEHIGGKELTDSGEKLESAKIYQRDIAWLKEADVLVAEVSIPSLGVGYEIAKGEEWGKRILCLYNEKRNVSAMIKGNPRVNVKSYRGVSKAYNHIADFLSP